MTTDESSVTTPSELNAELQRLLDRAAANGVDVEGGWECQGETESPLWDVLVTEVQRDAEPKRTRRS